MKEIQIKKVIGVGADLPPFLGLAHRHFEKAADLPKGATYAALTIPVDLLGMIAPADLLDKIEGVEVVYRRIP